MTDTESNEQVKAGHTPGKWHAATLRTQGIAPGRDDNRYGRRHPCRRGRNGMNREMQELLSALRNFDSAKTAHDEAMYKCETTWDYHGSSYIEALTKAEMAFAEALNAVIDARIESTTGARP